MYGSESSFSIRSMMSAIWCSPSYGSSTMLSARAEVALGAAWSPEGVRRAASRIMELVEGVELVGSAEAIVTMIPADAEERRMAQGSCMKARVSSNAGLTLPKAEIFWHKKCGIWQGVTLGRSLRRVRWPAMRRSLIEAWPSALRLGESTSASSSGAFLLFRSHRHPPQFFWFLLIRARCLAALPDPPSPAPFKAGRKTVD